MKDTVLAWAAGFFDGEGYITIPERQVTHKEKLYKSHYIRLGINHVDPRPLRKLHLMFGGTLQENVKTTGNRHPRCQWQLSCQEAKNFLNCVRPYLVNKDIAADLALQFFETISLNKKQLSIETIRLRQDLSTRLKLVNSLS